MRLTKTFFLLASAAVLVGCGSSDNTCGDAGCLDGAIVTGPDAGADGPQLWGLSRDMNNYTVTAVTVASDGCMLSPGELMGMSVPANYVAATNTLTIGKSQGTPAMPAFGSGSVGANMATLTRDNQAGDAMGCYWHQVDNSALVLFDNDKFTLNVTETDNMYAAACTAADKPGGDTCTTTFQLTFVKM